MKRKRIVNDVDWSLLLLMFFFFFFFFSSFSFLVMMVPSMVMKGMRWWEVQLGYSSRPIAGSRIGGRGREFPKDQTNITKSRLELLNWEES